MSRLARVRVPAQSVPVQQASTTFPLPDEPDDVPLLRVTPQRDVRLADISSRYRGMLGPVKDVDISHHRLGRDQVGVLRHVTSPVDLSRMVDRLNHLDPRFRRSMRSNLCRLHCISGYERGGGGRGTVKLTSTVVVVFLEREFRLRFWEVNRRDLDVVLVIPVGVGPNEHAVDRVVLVGRSIPFTRVSSRPVASQGVTLRLLVGKPLECERGPFERVSDD